MAWQLNDSTLHTEIAPQIFIFLCTEIIMSSGLHIGGEREHSDNSTEITILFIFKQINITNANGHI